MEIKNLTTQLFQPVIVSRNWIDLEEYGFKYSDSEIMDLFERTFKSVLDLDIEATEYWHPKSYNYVGDLMFFTLKLNNEDYKNLISYYEKWKKEICEWVIKYYRDRDGYISFLPWHKEMEWLDNGIKNHDGAAWSLLLEHYFLTDEEREVKHYEAGYYFFDLCYENLERDDEDE